MSLWLNAADDISTTRYRSSPCRRMRSMPKRWYYLALLRKIMLACEGPRNASSWRGT